LDHIVFFPSERSVLRGINDRKIMRLSKIAREAVEQSYGWFLPQIDFVDSLESILEKSNLVVFDKNTDSTNSFDFSES
jgi:RsmE family RNA methyltransferase